MRTRKARKHHFQLEPLEGRVALAPLPGLSLPDFVIPVVRGPRLFRPGTTADFFVTVKNVGKASYPGTIAVTGAGNVTGIIRGGLQPGQEKVAVVRYANFFVSPRATYTFRFAVDPDNIIRESNESNNLSPLIRVQTTG